MIIHVLTFQNPEILVSLYVFIARYKPNIMMNLHTISCWSSFWLLKRIKMDINKLKLEKFERIGIFNFPDTIDLGITTVLDNHEVIIYYIDKIEDVEAFVKLVHVAQLPKSNRTIMIYKKGRKDSVNRDAIIMPFRDGNYTHFKLRAPMLCSISKELSAFVMSFENEIK